MIILNNEEKSVLVCLLLEIINADGIVSDNEMMYFDNIKNKYQIDIVDFNRGQEVDPYKAIIYLKGMEDIKKATFCRIFQKMSQIDGYPFKRTTSTLNEIIIKARLLDSVKRCNI